MQCSDVGYHQDKQDAVSDCNIAVSRKSAHGRSTLREVMSDCNIVVSRKSAHGRSTLHLTGGSVRL